MLRSGWCNILGMRREVKDMGEERSRKENLERSGKGLAISNNSFISQSHIVLRNRMVARQTFYLFMVFLSLIGNPHGSVLSFLNRKVDIKSSRRDGY